MTSDRREVSASPKCFHPAVSRLREQSEGREEERADEKIRRKWKMMRTRTRTMWSESISRTMAVLRY